MKQHALVAAICLGTSLCAGAARAEDHDYDHAQPGLIIQNQVVVHESTNGTYFSLLGNDFGYGGVQQGSDGKRNFIFSFWDQNQEKTQLLGYGSDLQVDRIGRFGDNVNLEGTGFQLLFYSAWQNEAPIRQAYRASLDSDGQHLRASGFYREGNEAWRYAGTFRVATNGDFFTGSYGFVENYLGTQGPRKASYSNHWLYDSKGNWEEALSGAVLPQGEAVVSPEAGGILVEYKTPTQKDWEKIQWSSAPGNAALPIAYHVACGRDSIVTVDADAEGLAHLVDDIGAFEVDGYFSDGMGKTTADVVSTQGVAHAAPLAVYQAARGGASFSYQLFGLAPSKEHVLRLHFAESEATAAGQRTFDVTVNGAMAVAGLDVFAASGGKDKAWVEERAVRSDERGQIVIAFAQAQGSALPAMVSGLEVEEAASESGGTAGSAGSAGMVGAAGATGGSGGSNSGGAASEAGGANAGRSSGSAGASSAHAGEADLLLPMHQDDKGCACRMADAPSPSGRGVGLLLLALGAGYARRRRAIR